MKKKGTGYSGTPLAKKLGIVEGSKVHLIQAPKEYVEWIAPCPPEVVFAKKVSKTTDLIHLFVLERDLLSKELQRLRGAIREDGIVWVSWPKKTSKVATDITEDTIRQEALPMGFVDVKVCAVSEIWSGLKLVIRKELRSPP